MVRTTELAALLASEDWSGEARIRTTTCDDALQLEIGQESGRDRKHGFYVLSAQDVDELIALLQAGKRLLTGDARQLTLIQGGAA